MTSYPFKSVGEALWPTPSSLEYQCYMRGGAATAGDLLMQDFAAGDAATTTAGAANVRLSTHITANVVAPVVTTAGGVLHDSGGPFFAVAMRSAADDSLVRLCLFGYVSAFIEDDTDSVAIGDALMPDAAKNLDGGAGVANARIVAQAQEALNLPTTRTLGEVLINGVAGFANGHYDAVP